MCPPYRLLYVVVSNEPLDEQRPGAQAHRVEGEGFEAGTDQQRRRQEQGSQQQRRRPFGPFDGSQDSSNLFQSSLHVHAHLLCLTAPPGVHGMGYG